MSAADEEHWEIDEDRNLMLDLGQGTIVLGEKGRMYQLDCPWVDVYADDGPDARRYAVVGVRQQLVAMLAELDRLEREP